MLPKYGLSMCCDHNYRVQSGHSQINRNTDRQTGRQTDRQIKTEGRKILAIDIFYLKSVIIGGLN